jgi:NAD(P)-dependent dehydrogenase (short-subunit alcohol dehydrogenase family)
MSEETKIALVTGGSRGLGKSMAMEIAKKNIDVVITYRNNENLATEVVSEIKSMGRNAAALHLDMSDIKSLDKFISNFTSVLESQWKTAHFDFLINNAGMGATVPFEKVTEEIFDEFVDVHFKGVYFLTQKCLPMINSGGRIINISSGTTRFSNPGYSVYASMKGAVEVFTRYLAKELGPKNIGANTVAPGAVETDFNNAIIRNNPNIKNLISGNTPLGRTAVADDIGPVVAFLCTDGAKWVNGQRIEVSGGING